MIEQRNRPAEAQKGFLQICWPEGNLPQESLAEMVELSRTKSLRELVAREIIAEAVDLWGRHHVNFQTTSCARSSGDVAINDGFKGVGNLMLYICQYYGDGRSTVDRYIKAIDQTAKMNGDDQKGKTETTRRSIKDKMYAVADSLRIDPTGVDYLEQKLKEKEATWERLGKECLMKNPWLTKEDPDVIGFRIGLERYSKLYQQAVKAGAVSDRQLAGSVEKSVLRFKRTVYNSGLPQVVDLFLGK